MLPHMSEALAHDTDFISFREYLEGERFSEVRHEYVDGKVFAMAGASEAHELVALALASALYQHSKRGPCRVFKGDMKLKVAVQGRDLAYYPDIMATCDPTDDQPLHKEKPTVLIEVMSDYKADHVEKLFAYQQIPSLQEYLVVEQAGANRRTWLYRRSTGWLQENGAPEGTIELTSIGFRTTLEDVYGA